ncbi:MAG: TerB family tellurite resistance protein [Myxococcota bacterium]|nr:TerB family tellurite resistance protein [Myxococcota bacterium]
MFQELSNEERLRLMRFVCSFAWADLEVRQEERNLVGQLARKLGMSEREREQVARWLAHPPRPEEVDPLDIPTEHRKMFLAAAQAMIAIDGDIDPQEAATLELFEMLLPEPEE